MIILHPILCLLLGTSAGLMAREQLRRGASAWRSSYALGVLACAVFVLSPLCLTLALAYPAWSDLGLGGEGPLSLGLWLGLLGASALLALASFSLQALLKRQAATLASIPAWLGLAGFSLTLILFREPLSPSILGDEASGALAVTLVFSVPAVLAAWSFLLALYGLEGRKMRALEQRRAAPSPAEAVGLAATRASGQSS